MKKNVFLILLTCLLLAACGGESEMKGPQNPETTISTSPDPRQALLGLWVTEEPDNGGFRLGVQFQKGATGLPSQLEYYLYLVKKDGTDGGGVQGIAFVDDESMTIHLDGVEPLSGAYTLRGDSLTLGEYVFKRVIGVLPILSDDATDGLDISAAPPQIQ